MLPDTRYADVYTLHPKDTRTTYVTKARNQTQQKTRSISGRNKSKARENKTKKKPT